MAVPLFYKMHRLDLSQTLHLYSQQCFFNCTRISTDKSQFFFCNRVKSVAKHWHYSNNDSWTTNFFLKQTNPIYYFFHVELTEGIPVQDLMTAERTHFI